MQNRALGLLVIVLLAPVFLRGSELKRTTTGELESLGRLQPGRFWDPRFWDILVPDNNKQNMQPNDLVTVPAVVKEQATYWAKKVVKREWLPANLDQLWVGLRDIKQDTSGLIPAGYTVDLALAEYQIDGMTFHLVENGLTLSLRVDLPQGSQIADDQHSIGDSLKRFLNLDSAIFDAPYWTTVWWSPLLYGVLQPDEPRRDSEGGMLFEWWENVAFASDGTFLFASVREARDSVWKNVKPDWQPVPPDRF